jgi:pimeloyl-ACP methyl ester carboxylesterase
VNDRLQPEVDGVRHRFVEANGVRFHVAEAGPADAPGDPVLMLHGWPQNWFEWREIIPRFADHRRVICPDLRGLGWSDAPPRGYDKETFAADIVALLDALEVDRVDFIGHDWGGWAGFLLCLFHPERVRRFVALNISHPWTRFNVRGALSFWRFWYATLVSLPVAGPWVMRSVGRVGGALQRRADIPGWGEREREVFLGQFAEPERASATAQIYRTFLGTDLPRALRGRYRSYRLSTPTLLLYGADDQVVRPQNLEGWEPYADDMRVEFVPGISHFIADEAPELVARRALEHFAVA